MRGNRCRRWPMLSACTKRRFTAACRPPRPPRNPTLTKALSPLIGLDRACPSRHCHDRRPSLLTHNAWHEDGDDRCVPKADSLIPLGQPRLRLCERQIRPTPLPATESGQQMPGGLDCVSRLFETPTRFCAGFRVSTCKPRHPQGHDLRGALEESRFRSLPG